MVANISSSNIIELSEMPRTRQEWIFVSLREARAKQPRVRPVRERKTAPLDMSLDMWRSRFDLNH